ncbi:Zn(2)-C6 fungal-type domain-containing protein [Mycena indigotica]|uniref:Zn(2)-C6 fungal-type domain-containing protein n=1 Tax=Mycena indigotica TaxID=2126181 RepID=A0A8H6VVY3_9AGAR|nr:Zn(2)-C6 fungal-type domain-containing protein [Mycena indigotica]KAF7292128.1 Zn(2)-C6 fungal-type domain-containing protein [Mycena indigotica]
MLTAAFAPADVPGPASYSVYGSEHYAASANSNQHMGYGFAHTLGGHGHGFAENHHHHNTHHDLPRLHIPSAGGYATPTHGHTPTHTHEQAQTQPGLSLSHSLARPPAFLPSQHHQLPLPSYAYAAPASSLAIAASSRARARLTPSPLSAAPGPVTVPSNDHATANYQIPMQMTLGPPAASGGGHPPTHKRKERDQDTDEDEEEKDAEGEPDSESGSSDEEPRAKRRKGAEKGKDKKTNKGGSARRTNASAVIACQQCRSRKIRCDSTRPHCANCSRRGEAANCAYDAAPKRRGPDKKPGTRQRRCKKKIEEDRRAAGSEERGSASTGKRLKIVTDVGRVAHAESPISASMVPSQRHPTPTSTTALPAFALPLPEAGPEAHPKFPVPSALIQAAQAAWWERFLRTYTLREIATDLDALYTEPGPLLSLSFANPRFLLETLWSPSRRLSLQPAFVLASMAVAVLLRSHDGPGGAGKAGRERARQLREAAGEALEAAWGDGSGDGERWVDASLAEAALLLAHYEASAHADYHPDRVLQALSLLDQILHALQLPALDAGRPDVCRFAQATPPIVLPPPPAYQAYSSSSSMYPTSPPSDPTCTCLPPGTPAPATAGAQARALPWDPACGARALRDEECRRVVWGALSLATSIRTERLALGRGDPGAGLRICEPANYLVLFPNELYADRAVAGVKADFAARKGSVWALYCRSLLLANFCGNAVERERQRASAVVPSHSPYDYAPRAEHDAKETLSEALTEAWNEAQAIADALDAHVCGTYAAVSYLCRENIANTRMIIARGLRAVQGLDSVARPRPLFTRRQTREWVEHQATVIADITRSLSPPPPHSHSHSPELAHALHYPVVPSNVTGGTPPDARAAQLLHRPFAMPWFYHQLALCLLLWDSADSGDASVEVLELGKGILQALERMQAVWPCDYISRQTADLRVRLTHACLSASLSPPIAAPPFSSASSSPVSLTRSSPAVPAQVPMPLTVRLSPAHQPMASSLPVGVPISTTRRGAL